MWKAAKKLAGTLVSPWPKNKTDAQKWYDDPATGTIRTKLNDFCLDIQDDRLVINPYSPDKQTQQWERKTKNVIQNRSNNASVLDIADSNTENRAKVISYDVLGTNQHWTFESV